ncbi:SDR family oxidoreductase [Shewanella zhangzhouensis]|uniref:SDR family oxidoreductase n=1 Tax=Shewanella zhangzhouensis TaxID=2864213 RepID=UPI001C65AC60|nr:SDR family oxidoreductase [Shewanella zhangzhouensis]QYK07013.1 SDR family oxidoreductase [Shewanella zhangzhouensis]
MTILVLGATGNTGSEVVRQLKEKGADFSVLVRNYENAASLQLHNEQIRVGDFNNVASLTVAMEGVSRVYLAMVAHPDNKQWVGNVIEAMKVSGAQHLVKLSGMGASKEAGSEIIRMHAETDEMVKESGLNYTLVQPNSFYQNLFGSLETIKSMGRFFLPLRDAKQSIVDIRDVAAVAVEALIAKGHEGKTYLLSGPQALTFAEQAEILSKVANKDIQYIAVPKDAAEEAMKAAGMNEWLAIHLAEILDWFAQGNYDYVTTDVENVLGRPAITFTEFAEEFSLYIK